MLQLGPIIEGVALINIEQLWHLHLWRKLLSQDFTTGNGVHWLQWTSIYSGSYFHHNYQSCSIFISATPSIIGPSCSIIAQYLAWPGRQNGALPTWVYWSQTPPLQVTDQCDMGLTPLYVSKLFHLYWCNSLSVWSKLQHNILIFGLVMVEIWPAVYTSSLQPVYPITSRKILRQEFPSQM